MYQEIVSKNMEKALSEFINDIDLIKPLAQTLLLFLKNDVVPCNKIKVAIENDYTETLLLAFEWRLILPFMPTKTCAWEDRLLVGINAKQYEMPKAIFYIVREASIKAVWDVDQGLKKMFERLHIPTHPEIMANLVKEISKYATFKLVTAGDILSACRQLNMYHFVDSTIAIFKSVGILSPRLSHIGESSSRRGPVYELNPSVDETIKKRI